MFLVPDKEILIEFLRSNDLFHDVGKSALETLLADFETIHLEGQKTLIQEGDIGDAMFLVVHGRLRALESADTPAQKMLSEIGTGDVVGEIALMVDTPRTATVRAIRDSVVLRLSRANYQKFVQDNPKSGIKIAQACIDRLINVQKRVKVSKQLSAVAFIPLVDPDTSRRLMDALAGALQEKGTAILLTRAHVEAVVGTLHDLLSDSQKFERLLRFLNEQESAHAYVLYLADQSYTPWTEICVRQADAVYILNDGCAPAPASAMAEEKLLQDKTVASRVTLFLMQGGAAHDFKPAYDWVRKYDLRNHNRIDASRKSDVQRVARLITGKSVGLVLSGGGARGLAHVGVIRALEQANFPVDIIGGTSAGSIVAAAYALGLDSYEMEKGFAEHLPSGSGIDFTLPYLSLFAGRRLVKSLQAFFRDALIEETQRRFFCVSSNVTKNEVFVHETGLLWRAVRASVSLPGIYPPVFMKGNILVDGGVLDNLPVETMSERFGAGRVLASSVVVTSDKYSAHVDADALSGFRVLLNKMNPFARKIRVPRIDTLLMRTMNLRESTHQSMQTQNADFAFILNVSKFGLMDFKRHKQIVDAGYAQASEQIKKLLDLGLI